MIGGKGKLGKHIPLESPFVKGDSRGMCFPRPFKKL